MGLYKSTDQSGQPLNTIYAEDVGQFVDLLGGQRDGGALSLLGPLGAPAAPTITKQSGSITGTGYQWGIYWITGVMDGTGGAHVTGRTLAGTLSAATSLSAQEATVALGGITPPTGAIGWGVVRNKSGGSSWFEVPGSEQFLSIAGTMPSSFVDNVADASLVTATPAANTTGTTLSGAIGCAYSTTLPGLNAKFPSGTPPEGALGMIATPTGNPIPLIYDANAGHWYSPPLMTTGFSFSNGNTGAAVGVDSEGAGMLDYRPCRDGGLGLQVKGLAYQVGNSTGNTTTIQLAGYFFNGTTVGTATYLVHTTAATAVNFNDDWTTIVNPGSANTYDAVIFAAQITGTNATAGLTAYEARYIG